jgi:hypothetical protein
LARQRVGLRRPRVQLEWQGFPRWRVATVRLLPMLTPPMGMPLMRTPEQQMLSSFHALRRKRSLSARHRFLPKAPARGERFPLLSVVEKLI